MDERILLEVGTGSAFVLLLLYLLKNVVIPLLRKGKEDVGTVNVDLSNLESEGKNFVEVLKFSKEKNLEELTPEQFLKYLKSLSLLLSTLSRVTSNKIDDEVAMALVKLHDFLEKNPQLTSFVISLLSEVFKYLKNR